MRYDVGSGPSVARIEMAAPGTGNRGATLPNRDPGGDLRRLRRDFSVITGGNLTGTYTIPKFQNCLLATPLINLTVPGSGNTITLTLGAATPTS